MDLRSVLTSAAHRLAASLGTRLAHERPDYGLCLTPTDGPTDLHCTKEIAGKRTVNFLSPLGKRRYSDVTQLPVYDPGLSKPTPS